MKLWRRKKLKNLILAWKIYENGWKVNLKKWNGKNGYETKWMREINRKKEKFKEEIFKRKKNYNFNKIIEQIIWKLFPTGTNIKWQKKMRCKWILSCRTNGKEIYKSQTSVNKINNLFTLMVWLIISRKII